MPGLVTSMDVVPPRRTEHSGINLSRIDLIFFRLAKSESHFFFSSKGACWPTPGAWDLASPVFNRFPRDPLRPGIPPPRPPS